MIMLGGRNSVTTAQFTVSGRHRVKKRKLDSSYVSPVCVCVYSCMCVCACIHACVCLSVYTCMCVKLLFLQREFLCANTYEGIPKVQPIIDQCLVLCSKDHMIPSIPILHVRMLINCWELGLESVPEEAVMLMATAVEVNIL